MKLLKGVHAEDNKAFATILISIFNYGGVKILVLRYSLKKIKISTFWGK